MKGQKENRVKISLIQQGGMGLNREENIRHVLKAIDRVANREAPDFILLNETCTTPYFPMAPKKETRFFEGAEAVPGPTTDRVGELALKHRTSILFPVFERRMGRGGGFYNSCVVIGPNGEIIPGKLPDGEKVHCYSKVHLGRTVYPKYVGDETIYFKPGKGFPVFDTPKARIGILICYDRRFPESWRVLALNGAQIVFLPVAVTAYTVGKGKKETIEDLFEPELRTHAYENLVFAAACNKGGIEKINRKEIEYFGRSCVINPMGTTLRRAPARRPAVISQKIDLKEVEEARKTFLFYEARQPATYGPIVV